jgi:NACalpha-BTF3-like transcription factor
VQVRDEDVALLQSELEMDADAATRALRVHANDVAAALRTLINA